MRRLVVSMNLTLDGYMSATDGSLDWHAQHWSPHMGDALCERLAAADTILLGRRTYQAMAAYWPQKMTGLNSCGEDFGFANMMNTYPKIVCSSTLASLSWAHSRVVSGDVRQAIARLKKGRGRHIILYGSGMLAAALAEWRMVDEYQLWIHPVLLRKGRPLFTRTAPVLKPVEALPLPSGVLLLTYRTLTPPLY